MSRRKPSPRTTRADFGFVSLLFGTLYAEWLRSRQAKIAKKALSSSALSFAPPSLRPLSLLFLGSYVCHLPLSSRACVPLRSGRDKEREKKVKETSRRLDSSLCFPPLSFHILPFSESLHTKQRQASSLRRFSSISPRTRFLTAGRNATQVQSGLTHFLLLRHLSLHYPPLTFVVPSSLGLATTSSHRTQQQDLSLS